MGIGTYCTSPAASTEPEPSGGVLAGGTVG
jgi:hypothetical protein